jgi:hypothetical protein
MNNSTRGFGRGLAIACWVPATSLVAIEVYVSRFDGWGAWSAAPLLLLPLLFGIVIAGAGAARCLGEARRGELRPSSVALTAVALIPLAWLLVRRHLL